MNLNEWTEWNEVQSLNEMGYSFRYLSFISLINKWKSIPAKEWSVKRKEFVGMIWNKRRRASNHFVSLMKAAQQMNDETNDATAVAGQLRKHSIRSFQSLHWICFLAAACISLHFSINFAAGVSRAQLMEMNEMIVCGIPLHCVL